MVWEILVGFVVFLGTGGLYKGNLLEVAFFLHFFALHIWTPQVAYSPPLIMILYKQYIVVSNCYIARMVSAGLPTPPSPLGYK